MEIPNSGRDRISELPESLLHQILSFLSTRLAVQTSILSRRWRYLWRNVRNLEFDQREFSSDYTTAGVIQRSSTARFVNFVDWALILRNHESSVGRFQLWWEFSFDMKRASTWVEYALCCSVRELILIIRPDDYDKLPSNIFRCQSLEGCRLKTPYWIQCLPDSVGLSKLTSLSLEGINSSDDLGGLISNCPVLEDLSLVLETGDLNLYAPNLKWLSLSSSGIRTPCKIHISTPSLVSFSYDSLGLVECSLVHAPSLQEADISIRQDRDGNSGNVIQLIRSLCNVVALTLKKSTIELLFKVPDLSKCVLPFHNLHSLKLKYITAFPNKDNIQVIGIFLNKCPNLETFSIKIFEQGEDQTDSCLLEDDWKPEKLHYDCDLNHRKTIKIYGFDGRKDGLEFVNFCWRRLVSCKRCISLIRRDHHILTCK